MTKTKDERYVTVSEASEITGYGVAFIKMAIQQGTFPGSWIKNGDKKTYYIPKKALEDYMNHFHRSPSDELIANLILAYQELTGRTKKEQGTTPVQK